MSKIKYYHVAMVIRSEELDAIRSLFEDKSWPCYLKVLSDEIVADIIKCGFTDIFPIVDCEPDTGQATDPEPEVKDIDICKYDDSKEVDMETEDHLKEPEDIPISDSKKPTKLLPSRKSSRRKSVVLKHSDEKQINQANKRRGRSKARQDSKEVRRFLVLQCIDCGLKFESREEFWNHRDDVKHQLPTENIPTKYNFDIYSKEEHESMGFIKCEGCESYFLGKRRQMKHFYVVHRDMMPTPTCPICCKEFKSHAELLKHKREEGHRDSLSSLNNYQCDLCGKHMTSYSNFVQHKQFVCGIGEKEMAKIRIHDCELCGKLFKSPRHVRRHKKISHFKVPEMCDVCGALCQGRKALDVHKKRHDEKNKKHVCSDCGKAFFSDSKLQEHVRTHTKEKPFKCPLCTYTCAVKPNVHKHAMNVHKQTVSVVDLRKTQVNQGNNNAIENTHRVVEPLTNEQENAQTFICLKAAQDGDVSDEICKKLLDNYHTNLDLQVKANTLNVETLNNHSVEKYTMNMDQTCMSSSVTYTNTVSQVALHKHNINVYNNDDNLTPDMQMNCGATDIVYYNGREEKRPEYFTTPYSDMFNVSQY